MYDGRYKVIEINGDKAILEYKPGVAHITIPSIYKFKHGTIALDRGDIIHLYPTDGKLLIVMAPGFVEDYLTFELDMKTGLLAEVNLPTGSVAKT